MIRTLLVVVITFSIWSCSKPTKIQKLESVTKETPHDFMFMQRAYPSGKLNTKAYADAISWKNLFAKKNASTIWEFVGPTNIGGRVTDIEIPVDQSQTYYVGAASGGIFKTTNGGDTWNPIFDNQEMLSIGDIEISKNNTDILWVGTGEVNAGGGSLAYDGSGIYKSEDAGLTWDSKGLLDVGSIGKILIDPTNENTIFVGAMGPLFRDSNDRGVYRSQDGGATWEQKLFISDVTGIIDMAIHPSNGNIIYAASWERIRRPNLRQYGGATSGLYRSNDGGNNWIELTNGLPNAPTDKGRISIDISQSNPNILYSRYADAQGNIQGVYRTADGGDTWIEVNSNQLTNVGFHWWFRGIYVDPSDENTIYNVDFQVQKSTDGGNNWFTAFPGVHVDQHALAFNTLVTNEVVLGNDGGVYYSSNGGSSSVKDVSLPITQFYRVHVDTQNDAKVYGGSQDNSTIRTTTAGTNNWTTIFGGDGFQTLVDPTNTNVIYALSQNGNLGKSINNGNSFSNATNGISNGDKKNWDTPIVMDPVGSQTLYYGANRLYKTTDAAGTWTAISPDLTNGPHTGNLTFGTIISIDVSPLDTTIIYVGTDDGNVWVTNNGGSTWDLISAALPNRWVTKVLASRDDVNTVYVTFSGYRYGEDFGHVYKSDDRGVSWTDITGDLPDIPINDILKDNTGILFLGTDIGVLFSDNEGNNWQVLGENLPSVVVTDLHIHEASEYLYAGTYGRSMYKIDISEDVLNVIETSVVKDIKVFPNPASDFVKVILPNNYRDCHFEIYDPLGRLVKQGIFSETKTEQFISLMEVSQGVYYLKISIGNQQIVKKLLIKK